MQKLKFRNVHTHTAELGLEPEHCQQTSGLVLVMANRAVKAHLILGLLCSL